MVCVSTMSVFGLFGSTFPNALRATPGLKSLVSFESISNCSTLPSGTPSTFLRSGAGTYFGPVTKLSYASSGGLTYRLTAFPEPPHPDDVPGGVLHRPQGPSPVLVTQGW